MIWWKRKPEFAWEGNQHFVKFLRSLIRCTHMYLHPRRLSAVAPLVWVEPSHQGQVYKSAAACRTLPQTSHTSLLFSDQVLSQRCHPHPPYSPLLLMSMMSLRGKLPVRYGVGRIPKGGFGVFHVSSLSVWCSPFGLDLFFWFSIGRVWMGVTYRRGPSLISMRSVVA